MCQKSIPYGQGAFADLRIAGQMISQEQSMLGSAMSPRDKIKELVLYSISEDYFTARRNVGMNVT